MIKKNSSKFIFLLLISTLLISCSKKDKEKETDRTQEKSTSSVNNSSASKRAEIRWNALINKDWGKAYSFATPSYRKNYNVDQYKGSFGGAITWKSVKIISEADINDKLKNVKVELTIVLSEGGNMEIPSTFDERWMLKDGQWWHVKKK